jgi:glyoxylase-like metal-dependent hydrolase (beta-lactamase superfamily II)
MDMGMGGNLAQNMQSAGINPSEIDIVIITHAHPDHIGGTLDDKGNPVYSNAEYYIQKSEWDFWFSDQAFEMTNEWFVNKAREQLAPVKERMKFITKDTVIQPGVKLMSAPGHTPGHMIASFSSDGESLYYTGDIVLNPLHLEYPDWLPIYDILPEKAAVTKKELFNLFAYEKAWVIAQHFPPFPSLGIIEQKDNKWKWHPVIIK